jgi:hypothetical protein
MATSPYLSDFLAKQQKGTPGTMGDLLPPSIASGVFAGFASDDNQQNYSNLSRIGERIQQARANADEAYSLKQAKAREDRLMKLIRSLQQPRYSPSPGGGGGGGSYSPSPMPGLGRNPGRGGSGGGSILPPMPGDDKGVQLPRIAPPAVPPCTSGIDRLLRGALGLCR